MKWIPGDNPAEEGRYWVTIKTKYDEWVQFAVYDYREGYGRWWDSSRYITAVVAHMPYFTPEPYNPEPEPQEAMECPATVSMLLDNSHIDLCKKCSSVQECWPDVSFHSAPESQESETKETGCKLYPDNSCKSCTNYYDCW